MSRWQFSAVDVSSPQLPGQATVATPACVKLSWLVLSDTGRGMRLVMAASVTRPVCCSCSGSGHHLECPPAVLQCCSVQRPNSSSGTWPRPTANSSREQGPGLLPSPGYFAITNRTYTSHLKWNAYSFLFFSWSGITGCLLAIGIIRTLPHHQPG